MATSISPELSATERLAGGLLGLLVGDALGVPYEFHPPSELPPFDRIEMIPPAGFRRAHTGVAPGTWSDDGAQALVLLHCLLTDDGLDLAHFANSLLRWLHEGFCAVDGDVFDVGIQTRTALDRLAAGTPPEAAGPAAANRNGNGSLMRVLPLAFWHQGEDVKLMQLAARQSLPTHGHMRAQVCCALYCLWARAVLAEREQPWMWAAQALREHGAKAGLGADEIARILDAGNADKVAGSGYVLDTLWSALRAVESSTGYASCVRCAISLGDDTDTTACVAGGIAGLMYGRSGIPAQWRDMLRGRDILDPLLAGLLQHHGLHDDATHQPD